MFLDSSVFVCLSSTDDGRKVDFDLFKTYWLFIFLILFYMMSLEKYKIFKKKYEEVRAKKCIII